MSVNHYCGPFLRCKVIRNLARVLRNFKVCAQATCVFEGKSFPVAYRGCPECGEVLKTSYDEQMVRTIDWYEQIGDNLLFQAHVRGSDEFDILLPNDGGTPTPNRIPEESNERPFQVIVEDEVSEDKRKFRKHYESVIKRAEDICGADGATVCWGIVSYCM